MSTELITLGINAVATPLLVLVTMWIKNSFSKEERQQKREDGFIEELRTRIDTLEREVREVRAELKNRDVEYIELYKKYTTLRAQYDILQLDHEKLKKEYNALTIEVASLKTGIKNSADTLANNLQV